MTEQTADRWLSVRDIADQLSVSPNTVYRWIEAGDVQAVNLGRGTKTRLRVSAAALAAFLERRAITL